MGVGAVSANKKYILRYSLKGSNDNGYSLGAYLRKDGEPYHDITKRHYVKITSSRTENEILFSSPESQSSATLMFIVNNQNQEFWLDNIQFTEADVTETNPNDYIHFEYNASNSSKTVSLNGNFVDVKNNSYGGTITLPAYGSAVLIRSDKASNPVAAGPIAVEAVITPEPIFALPAVNTPEVVGDCSATGTILREHWDNVPGDEVSKIPLHKPADRITYLTSFEAPSINGDNYGARVSGFLCPPQSGNYIFTIAGDNGAELWLSSDDNPGNKVKIATSPDNGWTSPREWNKYASQQSAPVYLQAGKRYYIEALHKEGGGGDNLAVKWQMPNGVTEAPIPGNRLSPSNGSQSVAECSASGNILREHWDNVQGDEVSKIPVNRAADRITYLTSFEAPSINGDNYGARVRGYICPPLSGEYIFGIAGDNGAELWLSSDDNPNNKVRIATSPDNGWTSPREWNKYASQQSGPVYLQAGKRYYIEALHKEGAGGDNLAVKWQMPNGVTEAPIPGSRLSPWVNYTASAQSSRLASADLDQTAAVDKTELNVFPNPFRDVATVQIYATESGQASVEVFDLNGKLVQSLFSGVLEAGSSRTFKLNGDHLSSGMYIVRLVTKTKVVSQKVTLVK
jgi:hypothetical protein